MPVMSTIPPEGYRTLSDELVEQLARSLAQPHEMSLVLLEGDRGSGRRSLLEAAIGRLGFPSSLLRLDFEGFEPEGSSFAAFQEYHKKKWHLECEVLPEDFGSASTPAFWTAAVLSLAANLQPPEPGMLSRVFSFWPEGEVPCDREIFFVILKELTAERTVICHVPESTLVPDPLLHRLAVEAEVNPNFVLVLSCRRGEAHGRVVLEPSRFFCVTVEVCAPIEARTERPGPPEALAGMVSQFVLLASFCGDAIPADLLLDYLGMENEMRDSFLDAVDQRLVEGGLLEDLEYGHPSFPRYITYRFASPQAALAVVNHVPEAELSELRASFFSFLRDRMALDTRGAYGLFLEVAPSWAVAEAEDRSRELAWWVDEKDCPELSGLLADALVAGRLSPEILWRAIEETADRWPAFRRLALLEAYRQQPGRVPHYRAGDYRALRASALYDLDQFEDSLADTLEALRLLPSRSGIDARLAVSCQALAGLVALREGDLSEARARLGAVAVAGGAAEVGGSDSMDDILSIAGSLQSLEPEELLRSALEAARSISLSSRGFVGRRAADLWNIFADVLRLAGRMEPARLSLQHALGICRRFAGSQDTQLAIALKKLAEFHRDLGEAHAVRRCLEEAFAIEVSVFGENDEQVVVLLNHLIDLLLETGELEIARKCLMQAMSAGRSRSGEYSQEALILLKHLADVSCQLGEFEAARDFLAEASEVEERLHGSNNPQLVVLLKQLADIHRRLANRGQLISCRLRALRIEESIYGPEDLRILVSLKILEALLREEGDYGGAESLRERVHLIECRPPATQRQAAL
jgi:tetratricopeptide (TPR) repeat protein